MMNLRKPFLATLATLACISAAGASIPDDGGYRRYYNLHLRLVQGVRSGQVLADDGREIAGVAAPGASATMPAGLHSASSRPRDRVSHMDPAPGSVRRDGGDGAATRPEMRADSHD